MCLRSPAAAAAQDDRLAVAADVGDQLHAGRRSHQGHQPSPSWISAGGRRLGHGQRVAEVARAPGEDPLRLAAKQFGIEIRCDRQLRTASLEGLQRQTQVGHDPRASPVTKVG